MTRKVNIVLGKTAQLANSRVNQNLFRVFAVGTTKLSSNNNYSTKVIKKENFINIPKQLHNKWMNIFVSDFKNYSSSSVNSNNNTMQVLYPVQYELWSKEAVCSLLYTPKENGGAGLTDIEKVKPLYDAGFDGTFIAAIVTCIQMKDPFFALDQLKTNYKDAGIPLTVELSTTLQTVVFWVDNLLKTKVLERTHEPFVITLIQFDALSLLLREYPPRKSPLLLVESKVHVPFKTNPDFISQVSNTFESLSSANDKQNVFIPFLACGPGTGKSRTLQETYQLTKYGIQNKENSCIILISYGNGWVINDTESVSLSYEEGLCMRIVFSYLGITGTFSEYRNEKNYAKFKGCNLVQTLHGLGKHFNRSKNRDVNAKVVFYVAIDEFTELQSFSYNRANLLTKEVDKKTYLHGIISTLGNFITSNNTKSNITLLPMFAGLDYLSFTTASSHSLYGSVFITPYIYSSEDLYSIVKQHVPHLIFNNELWRRLACINRHARSLEYFIEELQMHGQVENLDASKISSSFNQAKAKVLSKYTKIQFDKQVAQQILALVLTETPISSDKSIVAGGPTFKQLEDWGYIRLIPSKKEANLSLCTCSLPILEKCWSMLEESKIFRDLFDKLLEDKPSTVDRPFEKLNGYFDMALNQCFIYLGKDKMKISERFRGIITNNSNQIANAIFDLKTFPTSLKEIDLRKVQSMGQLPKNTMVQFAAHNTKFFDRYYNAYYTQNGNQHLFTFLWQERGKFIKNRKFTESDASKIINEHFTKENIASINATIQNSFGIVLTTRPVSSVKIDTMGLIGREGLEEYYGSFIFKIIFCSGMPFPINQTFTDPNDVKRYSYQLAFLLGIDDRRAKTLHDQILERLHIMANLLKIYGQYVIMNRHISKLCRW